MKSFNGSTQISSFTGGMDMDSDYPVLSPTSFRIATNLRVLTNTSGTSSSITAIEGIKRLIDTEYLDYKYYEKEGLNVIPKYSIFDSRYTIIGVGVIRNYICLITVDDNGNNSIFRLIIDGDNIDLTKIISAKFDIRCDDTHELSIVTRWEDFDNVKIYWADGVNPLRFVNIAESQDTTNYDRPLLYFNNSANANLYQPEFDKFVSGNLKVGLVQYVYQLFTKNGSESVVSPLSQLIHITNTDRGEVNYMGAAIDTVTSKGVKLKFKVSDDIFSKCRVYSIRYSNPASTPLIYIASEFDLNLTTEGTNKYQYFTDTGTTISELTYEEFLTIDPYYMLPTVIESKDDRLFAANIIEDTWSLPTYEEDGWYDTRIFRFAEDSKNGIHAKVTANNNTDKIIKASDLLLSEANWKTFLPDNHDCINPWNTVELDKESSALAYQYPIDSINNHKGGTGRNISFKIIHTRFGEDYENTINTNDFGSYRPSKRGVSKSITIKNNSTVAKQGLPMSYKIPIVGNESYDFLEETDGKFNEYGPTNYSNPILSNKYRSYQRNEIYRFGVVFYNEKGQATPVNWMADIKMPKMTEHQHRLFDQWGKISNDSNRSDIYQVVTYPMGLQFTFKNLPTNVKQFEVVRCKRELADRRIVSQGLISKTFKETKTTKVQISRPPINMFYGDNYGVFWENAGYSHSSSAQKRNNYTDLINNDTRNNIPYIFTSPEISYFGDKSETNYNSIGGIEVLVGLTSTVDMSIYDPSSFTIGADKKLTAEKAKATGIYQFNSGFWFGSGETVFWTAGEDDNVWDAPIYDGSYAFDNGKYYLQTVGFNRNAKPDPGIESRVRLIEKLYSPFNSYQIADGSQWLLDTNNTYIKVDTSGLATSIPYDDYDNTVKKSAHTQVIGSESYQNWAPHNRINVDSSNYGHKTGAHGPAVVLNSKDLYSKLPTIFRVGHSYSSYFGELNMDYDDSNLTTNVGKMDTAAKVSRALTMGSTFLVNLCKNAIPYSGFDYSSRLNSIYISTNAVQQVGGTTETLSVFGGDTFIGITEYISNHWYESKEFPNGEDPADGDGGSQGSTKGQKAQVVLYYPCESSINLSLVHGSSFYRYANAGNYPFELALDAGARMSGFIQDKSLYSYNSAYSMESIAKKFVPRNAYSEDNKQLDYRVLYSESKTNDEIADSWLKYKVANYLDLDTRFGSVNNLKLYNNTLYFWQDDAFGALPVNERSLIKDNNQAELLLGTGGVLQYYQYMTQHNGSIKGAINNILSAPSGLYWYDHDRAELIRFTDSIEAVSKTKKIQSYFNTNKNNIKIPIRTMYDKKYNELHFLFNSDDSNYNNKHLIFSEQIDAFSGFYTYNADWFLDLKDAYYTLNNNHVYRTNSDNRLNKFYNNQEDSSITYIVNDNYDSTKVFDNIEYNADFENNNNLNFEFYTKTQNSARLDRSEIDQREDNYRSIIPRSNVTSFNTNNIAPMYNDRMRGKYLGSILTYSPNDGDTIFKLPYIKTAYRISNI